MSRIHAATPLLALVLVAFSGCSAPINEPSFAVETSNLETTPPGAVFDMKVTGTSTVDTDHIGGHYWFDSMPSELSASASDGGCAHQAGTLPGEFSIACTIHHIGTTYIYGHARYTNKEAVLDYWGEPMTVTIQPDADTFQLTATNVTTNAGVAEFDLVISGDVTGFSDHIGGHYWSQSTDAPTASGSDGGCTHVPGGGSVPGTYHVTCDMGEGTWTYRGHLRLTIDGEQWNYWTAELST